MSVNPRLLTLLLAFCASHGVAPDTPDAWSAWKTFKSFARATAEVPDPGVSVQLVDRDDGYEHVALVRQVLLGDERWLRPTGAVVWELRFKPSGPVIEEEDIWTFDFRSFDDFVDAVEQHETIAPLLAREVSSGEIYWEAADE